jgi:hypothetical protein
VDTLLRRVPGGIVTTTRVCQAPVPDPDKPHKFLDGETCGKPLPPQRRRFCSDKCCRRGRRGERKTETDAYAAVVERQIKSMGARASVDLAALQVFAALTTYSRECLALAVDGCRARGYSDPDIAAALGVTRQRVGQRFGRKRNVYTGRPETGGRG